MKSKFICYIFSILVATPLSLQAQVQDTSIIEDLLQQAESMDADSMAWKKYETAYTLSNQLDYENGVLKSIEKLVPFELAANNTSNALKYLFEELRIREKAKNPKKLAQVYLQIGDLYRDKSLLDEAIKYYNKAVQNPGIFNKEEIESLYEKLASSYAREEKPDSAQIYYAQLIDLADSNELTQLNLLRKIVAAYQNVDDHSATLPYNQRIRELIEGSPEWQNELGTIYNNLGYNHVQLAKYSGAIRWFRQAETHFQEDEERLAVLYNNLGIAYFNQRELKLSIQYLLKALSLCDPEDHLQKGRISNVLSTIYLQTNDYFNAQNFNRDAIEHARQSNDIQLNAEVYETAADIHSLLFEYEEAIKAYKTHLEFRDEILVVDRFERERLLQEKLTLEKTEKEVKLLLARGELQDLTIEQLKLEQERNQLEINNLNLEAQQQKNELDLLRQSEQLKETSLKNQELETQRARQALLLAEGQLEQEKQARELSELAQSEALTRAELGEKEARLRQEEQNTAILQKDQEILQRKNEVVQNRNIFLSLISLLVLGGLLYTRRINQQLKQQKLELEAEQQKSESLLLNILPGSVAQELKEKGTTTPRRYESVSILFSDFVGFTRIAAQSSPEQILAELNDCFMGFDAIMEEVGIEKIQTVGDAYLAVGGLPHEDPAHAIKCVSAAKKMISFLDERNRHHNIQWRVRVGIHSGTITAGVVGTKKFAYNIFGDTVNTAARIETNGEQGRINVSAPTYELIKEDFECEYRGKISAKGKGDLDMYFVK